MIYEIEKDIPMPTRPLAGDFPFANMLPGDSFLINGAKPQTVGYLAAVFARRQQPKWKFKVLRTTAGHRCWRLD